jgi:hypothetical protein
MVPHTGLRWARKGIGIAYLLTALLPAVFVLSHPMPVAWLRPLCKDTSTILAASVLAAILPFLFRCRKTSASSLLIIALTQAVFQAWCYNTGSHPAHNPFQIWGILPGSDAGLYYTAASDLLDGQQIIAMAGARHPYPLLFAILLKLFRHDLRSVTVVSTILLALATWSAFEVMRLRLGGLAATVYLACVTFYIRIHCTGLFMTEQLGLLYSLCAVGMLVESLAREGKAKAWLYCGGLFFLTQALNARPAAYMTLPFLVLVSWKLFDGDLNARCRMTGVSALVVAISLLLHSMTYHRVVASPAPSNAWFCIYGLLHGGTWIDGRNHAEELELNKLSVMPSLRQQAAESIYGQALQLLRAECFTEIRHHPAKLLGGWWRGLRFLWLKNTPYRAAHPDMPSPWFTESARWCAILGLVLSLFFLLRHNRLSSKFKTYQRLSWLNLAVLLGMIASLPFAPPWDGETRIFAATLPMFFLLPASGVGGLCLLIVDRFQERTPERKPDSQPTTAIGSALLIGGTLSIIVVSAAWCLVGTNSASKHHRDPVGLMMNELRIRGASVSSFDLSSLRAGYHLRLIDDTQPTWLPNISKKDFVENAPRGRYLPLSAAFNQLPAGTEVVALPYWALLVLDREDAKAQRFTPRPEQLDHAVSPPVYFSKGLHLEGQH